MHLSSFPILSRVGAVALFAITMAATASASTVFTLDQNGCSNLLPDTTGCGAPPYGTVTLTQLTPTAVQVTVTLKAGEVFVNTGAGESLAFELANTVGAIVIDNLTPGFVVGPAPTSASTFGAFDYSVHCQACSGGNPNNPAGPLTFNVNASAITIADFIANSQGYYFASDIRGLTGATGNVAALGNPSGDSVPEPATMALTGAGMLGVLAFARRRSAAAQK